MTAQRINNRLVFTTAAAAAALLLAGCGTGTPQSQTASTPASSAAASSASQPASSGAAAGPATSTPASAAPAPAGPALCKAAGLTATTDSTGGGAAGSVYMQLLLTNSGSESCVLLGFAGVSLTDGADGAPIGAAAARDSTPATEVLLEPGQVGAATLRYTQARNYPDCTVVPAAGFRIYPPEDTASLFIAQPRDACSNAGINLLTIGAFQAQ